MSLACCFEAHQWCRVPACRCPCHGEGEMEIDPAMRRFVALEDAEAAYQQMVEENKALCRKVEAVEKKIRDYYSPDGLIGRLADDLKAARGGGE